MSGNWCEFSFIFIIDGVEVIVFFGQIIMEVVDEVGVYIFWLCDYEGLWYQGSCWVCIVKVGGCSVFVCIQLVVFGQVVENEMFYINKMWWDFVEMLFYEGNYFCLICEVSGNCELQVMVYCFDMIEVIWFFYLELCWVFDVFYLDIVFDINCCISCGCCICVFQDVDGKGVFGYVGCGIYWCVVVNGENLVEMDVEIIDYVILKDVCLVGCIICKCVGFVMLIGEWEFDYGLIGYDIEEKCK